MEDISMTELSEDAIPAETNAKSAEVEADGGDTTPGTEESTPTETQTAEEANTTDSEDSAGEVNEPLVAIRYNHEDRYLTMAEAATLSQKGLAYEGTVAAVRELAASRGKSVKDYISGLMEAQKSADLERLKRECGGNEEAAKRLLAAEEGKHAGAVKKMIDDESAETEADIKAEREKIAAQYEELRELCPEIKNVKDIPQSVLKTAAEKKISLLDAYLRYQHTNAANTAKAKETAAASAAASAGSMRSGACSGTDPLVAAMRSGMWG